MGTLRKLDLETVGEMVPIAIKAGKRSPEVRDTAHPGDVTEMLMALLLSFGNSFTASQIHKQNRQVNRGTLSFYHCGILSYHFILPYL